MLKTKNVIVVEEQEWNRLVISTYGKPYHFQQQDGCRARGTFELTIPSKPEEDLEPPTLAEWLETEIDMDSASWEELLKWDRSFYPNVQLIANDLLEKGLLVAGEYMIVIDW